MLFSIWRAIPFSLDICNDFHRWISILPVTFNPFFHMLFQINSVRWLFSMTFSQVVCNSILIIFNNLFTQVVLRFYCFQWQVSQVVLRFYCFQWQVSQVVSNSACYLKWHFHRLFATLLVILSDKFTGFFSHSCEYLRIRSIVKQNHYLHPPRKQITACRYL